ncbi:hypothetical protein [Paenibacillus elgii]|uniref:hypothetical protein n=1 Tax=Paenibacillus elgii TaxID=189691 RepID=UPI001112073D|nr:hypothetical protein [Paenibacillus elgii]
MIKVSEAEAEVLELLRENTRQEQIVKSTGLSHVKVTAISVRLNKVGAIQTLRGQHRKVLVAKDGYEVVGQQEAITLGFVVSDKIDVSELNDLERQIYVLRTKHKLKRSEIARITKLSRYRVAEILLQIGVGS